MDILSGNYNINFLKIFLSLIVMARHLLPFIANGQPESYIYFLMYGLSKLSVPLFLIITGYYIGKKADDFRYILQHIAKYCCQSSFHLTLNDVNESNLCF